MKPSFTRNNFDLLRLFAATQVMLLHAFVHLRIPFPGWFSVLDHFEGVPMFFTMSGFLVSASWERHPRLAFFSSIGFLHAGVVPWFVSQLAGFYYSPGPPGVWGMFSSSLVSAMRWLLSPGSGSSVRHCAGNIVPSKIIIWSI